MDVHGLAGHPVANRGGTGHYSNFDLKHTVEIKGKA